MNSSDGSEQAIVGLGYKQAVDNSASFDDLWKVFVMKVYHPDRFLPVTDVKTRDNADGSVYREMSLHGTVIIETIYLDKEKGEVRFVVLRPDGQESDLEHVNALYRGTPMQIEYYQRKVGGERVSWETPRKLVAAAIRKQLDLALQPG